MRVLLATLLTAFIGLMINGCSGQEKGLMDSEMSSMGKSMESSMKTETMMKDSGAESMKPKAEEMKGSMDSEMNSMDKQMESNMKAETMMEDSAAESLKPKVEAMDKTTH